MQLSRLQESGAYQKVMKDTFHDMQVLVIYSVSDRVRYGEISDIITDQETVLTAQTVFDSLVSTHWKVGLAAIHNMAELGETLKDYRPETTIVFNLCESIDGESRKEPLVPQWLEQRGFCCVGASRWNLMISLNKEVTKKRLLRYHIPTAPFQVFRHENDPVTLPMPVIVKPVAEDCSLGIGPESFIQDHEALRWRVAYILHTYRQPALAEVYLSGREFTVSIWGNNPAQILEISEIDYSDCLPHEPHYDDFVAKWSDRHQAIHPAVLTAALQAQICRIAADTYRVMKCRDIARIDLRELDGQLYVLDVNPNPDLALDSGFAKAAQVAGYSYSSMVNHLLELAWQRCQGATIG